jgi:hypothetical protein
MMEIVKWQSKSRWLKNRAMKIVTKQHGDQDAKKTNIFE